MNVKVRYILLISASFSKFIILYDCCSAVKIRPKEEEVYFDIVSVVDPVTRDAQKLAPLLLVIYLACIAAL